MQANAENARALVRQAVPLIAKAGAGCAVGCDHALDFAVITAPSLQDPSLAARLDAVAGRVLARPPSA
jgi:5'-methylthioadenosine phosphorylase